MTKVLFKEEQKYDQWWFWLMLMAAFAVAVGPVWYGLIYQVNTGQSWGDEPSSNGELALIASLVTLLMAGIGHPKHSSAGGMRFGYRKYNKAFTITGRTGLKLFLKNGKI